MRPAAAKLLRVRFVPADESLRMDASVFPHMDSLPAQEEEVLFVLRGRWGILDEWLVLCRDRLYVFRQAGGRSVCTRFPEIGTLLIEARGTTSGTDLIISSPQTLERIHNVSEEAVSELASHVKVEYGEFDEHPQPPTAVLKLFSHLPSLDSPEAYRQTWLHLLLYASILLVSAGLARTMAPLFCIPRSDAAVLGVLLSTVVWGVSALLSTSCALTGWGWGIYLLTCGLLIPPLEGMHAEQATLLAVLALCALPTIALAWLGERKRTFEGGFVTPPPLARLIWTVVFMLCFSLLSIALDARLSNPADLIFKGQLPGKAEDGRSIGCAMTEEGLVLAGPRGALMLADRLNKWYSSAFEAPPSPLKGTLTLRDDAAGAPIVLRVHTTGVECNAAVDGRHLWSWSTPSRANGGKLGVSGWSRAGSLLAVAAGDGSVTVLSAHDGRITARFGPYPAPVRLVEGGDETRPYAILCLDAAGRVHILFPRGDALRPGPTKALDPQLPSGFGEAADAAACRDGWLIMGRKDMLLLDESGRAAWNAPLPAGHEFRTLRRRGRGLVGEEILVSARRIGVGEPDVNTLWFVGVDSGSLRPCGCSLRCAPGNRLVYMETTKEDILVVSPDEDAILHLHEKGGEWRAERRRLRHLVFPPRVMACGTILSRAYVALSNGFVHILDSSGRTIRSYACWRPPLEGGLFVTPLAAVTATCTGELFLLRL